MSALSKLDPEKQAVVRAQVKDLLDRTGAYRQMPPDERVKFANGLVNTVAYLADPTAGQPHLAEPLAEKKEKTGAEKVQDRLAKKPGVVGSDFEGGALEAGTDAFDQMVDSVDFPAFVSGLIEGVFTSIVDSSIRQMEAYGKLLENVVKSVEEFANDNITPNQARDYLRNRFPGQLSLSTTGGVPSLRPTEAGEENGLEEIQQAFGIEQTIDLEDEASESELVRRAQLEMARLRQQQLSTMVLLGINRVVVTDGLINAKVVFDMKASDTAGREARASMFDKQEGTRVHGGSDWFTGDYDHKRDKHTTVVKSSVDDSSESRASVKAKLSGEVRVNFKSETFPLEQMASQLERETLQERSKK